MTYRPLRRAHHSDKPTASDKIPMTIRKAASQCSQRVT